MSKPDKIDNKAKGLDAEIDGEPIEVNELTEEANDPTYYQATDEDDDGYDPYSDRPAPSEPLFERDPWN